MDVVILTTETMIAAADGTMATFQGVAKNTSVTFDNLKRKIFLVVYRIPVRLLTGLPEVKRLNVIIDLGGQYVDFSLGGKTACNRLEPDRTIDRMEGGQSDDEEFTTDFSTTSSV